MNLLYRNRVRKTSWEVCAVTRGNRCRRFFRHTDLFLLFRFRDALFVEVLAAAADLLVAEFRLVAARRDLLAVAVFELFLFHALPRGT